MAFYPQFVYFSSGDIVKYSDIQSVSYNGNRTTIIIQGCSNNINFDGDQRRYVNEHIQQYERNVMACIQLQQIKTQIEVPDVSKTLSK